MSNVYVNRTLNLKRIKYIGLDMDHTLIRYNSFNFESLAHDIMVKKLLEEKKYPEGIKQVSFDYNRAIRGLVMDKNKGNVLKLSRYAAIRGTYHGLSPLDYASQQRLYKSTYIDLSDADYDTVDTAFSIAFAGLFMQLVELKNTTLKDTLPDYRQIAEDLTGVLDRGHRDGSIKDVVKSNLGHFIIKDEATVRGLERYKKHGKKIFVLTNSDFHYSKVLLDYAINPFLKDGETWQDLFEFVITSAQKPRFFFDRLRFLKINPADGSMTNMDEPLKPGIYQGGCANLFTSDLHLNPDEILYIGDHIYGDIVRLKKDCAWRTALVIEELEDEISKIHKAQPIIEQINHLMDEKIPLELKVDNLISEKIELGDVKNEAEIDKNLKKIHEIDLKLKPLIKQQQSMFNPLWGEVMRVGIEESYFANQMERFACIYMTRISDLLELSPRTYFRSSKRPLAHDIQHQKDAPL